MVPKRFLRKPPICFSQILRIIISILIPKWPRFLKRFIKNFTSLKSLELFFFPSKKGPNVGNIQTLPETKSKFAPEKAMVGRWNVIFGVAYFQGLCQF